MRQEKLVTETVENLRSAMIAGDAYTLNNIADKNLSYGHSNGYVEDKEEFIRKLVTGLSNFEKIDLSDQNIKIFGTTAVVRHKFFAQTNDSEKGVAFVNLSILLIFKKISGTWKLIARQAVKQG